MNIIFWFILFAVVIACIWLWRLVVALRKDIASLREDNDNLNERFGYRITNNENDIATLKKFEENKEK